MLSHKFRRLLPAFLAIATSMTIVITQSHPAQAINLGQLIPRILPSLIETIQLASISPKQEMALGQEINAQLTKQQMRPLRDNNLSSYVSDLGRQIASRSKRQEVNYTFQVVDDNNINAAATMGGFVYINKGTIMAADNEAQLASVIAHEIAHIEGRHTIEQAKNSSLARTGAAALKLDKNTLIGLASRFALDMPRSRRFEMNADMDGLRMLREAGYDQQGMVEFMNKLASGSTPSLLKAFSTHPAPSDRVKALKQLIQRNPNQGTAGTDVVAYARRVGKPIPKTTTPIPAANPSPVSNPPANNPPVNPGNEVIVPTE